MDGNLLVKKHYILQRLREIIRKNGRALYDVASKQIGVGEETTRMIVHDFPADVINLEDDQGVTIEAQVIRDIKTRVTRTDTKGEKKLATVRNMRKTTTARALQIYISPLVKGKALEKASRREG